MRLSRPAPPRYRPPLRPPAVLFMHSSGRLAHTRRDHYRASSDGKRAGDPEAKVLVSVVAGVPVAAFLLRLAERRSLGLLFQDPPRKARRQGAVQALGIDRAEPAALQDQECRLRIIQIRSRRRKISLIRRRAFRKNFSKRREQNTRDKKAKIHGVRSVRPIRNPILPFRMSGMSP